MPQETSLKLDACDAIGLTGAIQLTIENDAPDGNHCVYAQCSSPHDDLYDFDSEDAVYLIDDPKDAEVRTEKLRKLAHSSAEDPRWVGFGAEMRIARYGGIPKRWVGL